MYFGYVVALAGPRAYFGCRCGMADAVGQGIDRKSRDAAGASPSSIRVYEYLLCVPVMLVIYF